MNYEPIWQQDSKDKKKYSCLTKFPLAFHDEIISLLPSNLLSLPSWGCELGESGSYLSETSGQHLLTVKPNQGMFPGRGVHQPQLLTAAEHSLG